MDRLLEIRLPVAGRDADSEAAVSAAALMDPWVLGSTAVELRGYGPYGEERHLSIILFGYMPETAENRAVIPDLQRRLMTMPWANSYGNLQIAVIDEVDWADAWKMYYKPLRLGERILVSPTWESPALRDNDVVVWLDPGMAFGTGTHSSTQLVLRLLERYLQADDLVLDVGTGSGVLSIAAIKLGADGAVSTDIDSIAVAAARSNATYNQVGHKMSVKVGSVPEEGLFELICVNILADEIARLLLSSPLLDRLAKGGTLLLSGIIRDQFHIVQLALAARGLVVVESLEEDDWLALAVRIFSG